jgi:hypothetical protein
MTWEPITDNHGQIRGVRMSDSSQRVIRWDGICDPYTDWGQANARMIVAAPEMLAALEDLLILVEFQNVLLGAEESDKCTIARAAIAKAREA